MKRAAINQGFTLVEMLVVLAIMAATLAISLPYVKGSGDARILETTAQTVATRLRETQSAAMFNNTERTFSIDLKHHLVLAPDFQIPQDIAITVTTADNEVSTGLASIRFFAYGGSTGGKITLTKGKVIHVISINWLTGAIAIEKVSPL